MNREALLETLRKLNDEITQQNALLFAGVFLLLMFLVAAFICNAALDKPVLREFMLVMILSGIWFVVRQELMIHSPGQWIKKAEVNLADLAASQQPTHQLRGWENDRQELRLRPIMLLISDLLAGSIAWYILYRLRWEYPTHRQRANRISLQMADCDWLADDFYYNKIRR